MLMPASSEFITLCRTQVAFLVDGFGASLSAIYLTEDPTTVGETALIPLVIYPEEQDRWPEAIPLALPETVKSHASVSTQTRAFEAEKKLQALPSATQTTEPAQSMDRLVVADGPEPTRMVLPLLHNEMVWGLMVVAREQQRWSKREQSQLEQVAQTLAIACVLDQRSQWLTQNHEQRRVLQAQQETTLSTLLHQFRNPLTTLRTLGKLMIRRLKPSDANRTLAESIVTESDHLEQLLRQFDDAIDLGEASLETEDLIVTARPALPPSSNWLTGSPLALQPCWLSEILHPLLDSMAGRVDEKEMDLQVSIPQDLPPVKADAIALREVFGNLIENALKYTPAGGTVWVNIEQIDLSHPSQQHPSQQRVQIRDTGPGIPPEDLERIFERNYRGVQAQTDIPGTGLGLAIARDLILQMGGTLQALSPNPTDASQGKPGSTFTVQLWEYSAA
jgi:signal transduction histidine kinase